MLIILIGTTCTWREKEKMSKKQVNHLTDENEYTFEVISESDMGALSPAKITVSKINN